MRTILACLTLLAAAAASAAGELVYEGTWTATSHRLRGPMIAVITDLGNNTWHGHFRGALGGNPFSYKVIFNGPPNQLAGKVHIERVNYEWVGALGASGTFIGQFAGGRYVGTFGLTLKRK